ncbi:MAG: hypothetical protein AAGB11_08465 [Pseudomonadota bacterium]
MDGLVAARGALDGRGVLPGSSVRASLSRWSNADLTIDGKMRSDCSPVQPSSGANRFFQPDPVPIRPEGLLCAVSGYFPRADGGPAPKDAKDLFTKFGVGFAKTVEFDLESLAAGTDQIGAQGARIRVSVPAQ